MIKRIAQNIKTKKLEKLENFFQSGDMEKKSRLRAFARTRAKNKKRLPFYQSQNKCVVLKLS